MMRRAVFVAAIVVSGCAPLRVTPVPAPCPTNVCCEEAKLSSPRGTPEHQETFHNASDKPVQLIWRDYDGRRQLGEVVPPLGRLHAGGRKDHVVVVANLTLDCQTIYRSGQLNVVWDGARIVPEPEVPAALAALRHKREARDATFRKLELAGFKVNVSPEADAQPETAEALKLLEGNLSAARDWLTPEAQRALAPVSIWVEWNTRSGNALFHYGLTPDEMIAAGENPTRAHAIELANVKNFLSVMKDDQPWAVVHEVAHALHDLVLGLKNPQLEALYRRAVDSKKLENVHHSRGPMRRAYALNSAYEYFAERSTAYLATNPAWPFDRQDFAAAEPEMFEFVRKAWGPRPPLPSLPAEACSPSDTLPASGGRLTAVRFFDGAGAAWTLATADADGKRVTLDGPSRNGNIRYLARVGQQFLALRPDGSCAGRYTAQALPAEVRLSK
jgi:hypothetical protein